MTTVAEVRLERRLLAGAADGSLDNHLAEHGKPPVLSGTELIESLRAAGLTGRGGAGFPVWRKLAAVTASGRAPVVIGNGAEGEPVSGKDKALLAYRPHLVLDGLQIVARAIGAHTAHLYLASGAIAPIRAALAARANAALDRIRVETHAAPDAFVASEESAVVAALSGRPAVPADKRIRIVESGLGGAPTLVQNVETLAHIALIARHGPQWFSQVGADGEPGTFLATVDGAVTAPGVVEAGYGTRLGDLIDAAGGPAAPLRAVLIGGYHGAWVPADPELLVSRAGLAEFGASPGAGVIWALPVGACGLAETARITGYLAGQVAGQCGPCVNGLPRLADTMRALAEAGTHAGPALDRNARPALDRPARPALDRNARPALDRSARPALDRSARPALDRSARPALDRSARPALDRSARPALDRSARPALDRSARPALDRNARPALDRRVRPGLAAEVRRLAALVTGRGACRHPDGTARLIASAMRAFAADVDAHLAGHCLETATGAER